MPRNKFIFEDDITLSKYKDSNGNWNNCDRGGCQVNTYNIQNADLVTTTLEQNGKSASFRNCNQGNYVADMAPSFDGMVFSVFFFWVNSLYT